MGLGQVAGPVAWKTICESGPEQPLQLRSWIRSLSTRTDTYRTPTYQTLAGDYEALLYTSFTPYFPQPGVSFKDVGLMEPKRLGDRIATHKIGASKGGTNNNNGRWDNVDKTAFFDTMPKSPRRCGAIKNDMVTLLEREPSSRKVTKKLL